MCLVERIVFYSSHKTNVCCQIRNTKPRVILSYKITHHCESLATHASLQVSRMTQRICARKLKSYLSTKHRRFVTFVQISIVLSIRPFPHNADTNFYRQWIICFCCKLKTVFAEQIFPFHNRWVFSLGFFDFCSRIIFNVIFSALYSFAVFLFVKWAWTYRAFYQDLRYAKVNRINKTV